MIVSIDDTKFATLEPYDPLASMNVTDHLAPGNHQLVAKCRSVAGPAAFFVVLEITYQDDTTETVVSDVSWQCDSDRVVTRGTVDRELLIPSERRIGVTATDNYAQWKQALKAETGTDPASFQITPDFAIQLVRSATDDESSWVSLAFDPQGRVIIAKETQGILRMTLAGDGSTVTKTETINDTLKECRGLLFVGEELFANANNSKGLYRLRPDGTDGFSEPELIFASEGGVGHGRNDLALGPDGRIYSIHGDSVRLPKGAVDYTSPFRLARQGKQTSEGHLLRIDPSDGRVEILAAGLRNPFGIDFNGDGEIFTYDADAEYDMGSPWYRPTRVSHLVTGGDYGWRGVTKSWPSYYPDHADNARPNLDIGKGSPTAVKFGTRSHFPPPYRNALFILDWTYGRIIAVHALPRGASYLMTAETFLKGRPLNVVDLDFSPEGSMYLVTGGRKTRSALYRVRYIGERRVEPYQPTLQQSDRQKFAKSSRTLRKHLESELIQPPSIAATELAWRNVNDSDPWIRHAAINLLERQDTDWMQIAFAETDPEIVVPTMLVIARSLSSKDDAETAARLIEKLNQLPLQTATRSDKLSALQSYFLASQTDLLTPAICDSAATRLGDLYPDESYKVNRLLSELLVLWEHPTVIAETMALLAAATDPTERMQYLYVLRNVSKGWTDDLRRDYFTALASNHDFVGGEGMKSFLAKIREDATATLSPDQRKALGRLIEPSESMETIVQPTQRQFVRRWTVDELVPRDGEMDRNRDLIRGQKLFIESTCVNCHRFAGRGTFVGPDLTSIGQRFGTRDLLTSIVEPSAVIAQKYQSLQVVLTDGKSFVGQVALGGDYRSERLRLAVDPHQPFKTLEIDKSEIQSQRLSPVSWMPEGLLDRYKRAEILDLIAFLRSAR
ncbi:MAG: c-type cytochrome [Pirellulaceae bacterium]|nr:c-type cytochrome [Pirellulaceae bacterium]